ncbi:MAG TPA: serine/threonine-protein kinase [Kofleriaceae bacterium]|nr:serine/threonine-protein kinase [Kofleriaceae bacterium]
MGITSVPPERPTAAARPQAGRTAAVALTRRAAGGRYVLGELLGRGGMAEVFAGQALGSLGFQKPVAIKRLLPERARDEEFVGRLVAEAKLLVALQHTNVISVLDLVREGDDVFLVMEFVDGPSLRQLLNVRRMRNGAPHLSLGLAAYVVQAACAGLEYAHARPTGAIIHADVSPSNVLLTKAGEVKVADFGIARREGIAAAVEGKWAYMPPEQARGEALTPRSDEFALGVVLYELITGVHPFARRVSEHGREEGAVENVRPPRALRPEIPLHLEAACLRAMAPEPADRYARLQQLHDALAEIRFACGWREGAAELAAVIAELGVSAGEETAVDRKPAPSKTQVTSNPVTLVTKSLILEGTDPSHPKAAQAGGVSAVSGAGASGEAAVMAMGTVVGGGGGGGGGGGRGSPGTGAGAGAEMGVVGAMWASASTSMASMASMRGESPTPHAWASETAPARGKWRGAAAVLAAAGVVGVAIAAMIVTRSPESLPSTASAAGAATASASPSRAATAPTPVTVTAAVTETGSETGTETGPETETETETESGPETGPGSETGSRARAAAPTGTPADEIQMEADTVLDPATPTTPGAAKQPRRGTHAAKRTVEKPRAKVAAAVTRDESDDVQIDRGSDRGSSRSSDRDDRDDDDGRDRDDAGAPSGTGTVRIYAKPWAYVESGGKRFETPTTLTLPAGVHDLSLYNPESKIRKTVTVTIRPGKPKTLNVRLVP